MGMNRREFVARAAGLVVMEATERREILGGEKGAGRREWDVGRRLAGAEDEECAEVGRFVRVRL